MSTEEPDSYTSYEEFADRYKRFLDYNDHDDGNEYFLKWNDCDDTAIVPFIFLSINKWADGGVFPVYKHEKKTCTALKNIWSEHLDIVTPWKTSDLPE